jgi:tRNA (adenine57-N1/adenine58-N1)-methyltransferase
LRPFESGEHVLFVDKRGRLYLVKLVAGKRFNSHTGHFELDEVVGLPEGSWVTTSRGNLLLAIRPTMGDYTRLMPRTATVVYPKDLGGIIINGDIFPGATVVEAGCGSGAVTIALMRAVGPEGFVHSFDLRQDMVDRATQNVSDMAGKLDNVSIQLGDVSEALAERAKSGELVDRIVFDMPEPWGIVDQVAEALVPGGILVSFLPTVLQIRDLSEALRTNGRFVQIETTESLVRSWTVANRSVRPDHRMVGHTGFLTTARLAQPKPGKPDDDYSGESPDSSGESGESESGASDQSGQSESTSNDSEG